MIIGKSFWMKISIIISAEGVPNDSKSLPLLISVISVLKLEWRLSCTVLCLLECLDYKMSFSWVDS